MKHAHKYVVGILVSVLMLAIATNAATYTVTKIADTNDGVCDADCSLREAIGAANGTAANDDIVFSGTVFSTAQTISLSGSELAITNNGTLTITGTGADRLTISGGYSSRVFNISNLANVSINGLAITLGRGFSGFGGGISNSGILQLNSLTVSNCSANGGGGIFNEGTLILSNSTVFSNSSTFKGGGGILTHGVSSIFNSTISGNSSAYTGGGMDIDYGGTINLTNATIGFNSSVYGGGGVYGGFNTVNSRNSIIARNLTNALNGTHDFYGTLTSQGYNLIGVINGYGQITGNTAGNMYNIDPLLTPLQNNGGATMTHALQINSPAINAGSNALALDANNQPLTTDQRGAGYPRIVGVAVDMGAFETNVSLNLRVDTNGDNGSLSACTATANDCSLRGAISRANAVSGNIVISFESGFASAQTITLGGSELTISNSGMLTILGTGTNLLTISGNNSNRVFNISSGSNVKMSDLKITQGYLFSANGGAGIFNNGILTVTDVVISNNVANIGGGISNFGTATVVNSTINNNSSDAGGGIYNYSNSLTVINSTLSGNGVSSYGGGICNNTGTTKIINSTIYNNSADIGGGIYQLSTGIVNVGNSIIAGNVGGYQTPDFRGNLTSLGYNLIGNTTDTTISGTTTGNLLNINPLLGTLQNNGGTTMTHSLLTNSPAINAGSNALALDANNQPLINDQRGAGYGRFAGGQVDIGATEAPGTIVVTNTNNYGAGSFRQAVLTANSTNYPEIITFSIPGSDTGCTNGVCNIAMTSSDPNITVNEVPTSGWLSIDNSGGATSVQLTSNYKSLTINGGAIVTVKNITFNNRADVINYGSLSVYNSAFLVNTTVESWGTLVMENSFFTANGGTSGITNGGTATVLNVTISGAGNVNYGGAIRNYGVFNLTNSTISGNSSANSGGGIHNTGTFNLTNSTVAGNSTPVFGGGVYVYSGTFNSRNSIIADNTAGNSGLDVSGTLTSQGYNLIGNTTGATISGTTTGNILNQNARLAPLGFYGGAMQTRALLANSPAVNAGNTASSPTTDQRGAARIGTADIGAFELNNNQNGGSYAALIPNARQNVPYNFSFTNNNNGFTYSVTGGTLPNGVSLNANLAPNAVVVLSGTPTQGGIFNFAVTATDGTNSNVTNYTLQILAPTAASVGVSGQVLTAKGGGLQNAIVTMTDLNGGIRSARTSSFGYFVFENVEAGQTYIFQVNSKRYIFTSQVVTVAEDLNELNFIAQE